MATTTIVTSSDYIAHHLVHWQWKTSVGVFNVDTILFSLVLGVGFFLWMSWVVSRFSIRQPGRGQLCAEWLIGFVESQVGNNVPPKDVALVGSVALTVFVWIFLMNTMDLIPVDLFPQGAKLLGVEYLRVVPTADMNATFALSIMVVFLSYVHGVKSLGWLGWLKHWLFEPFGPYLFPINVIKHVINDFSRIVSLSLRLFGNMYSGELVFILIAGLVPYSVNWVAYWPWLAFHLLVVSLQAFIFMVLSIIYISMASAHDE